MALLLGGYISRLKLAKLAVASKPGERGGGKLVFSAAKVDSEEPLGRDSKPRCGG